MLAHIKTHRNATRTNWAFPIWNKYLNVILDSFSACNYEHRWKMYGMVIIWIHMKIWITVQVHPKETNWNVTSQWRHNGCDGVSNHQPHECFPNRLFRRRSKKTAKLRVTGLCEEDSPVTGEFPAQSASNAENNLHLMTSSWKLLISVVTRVNSVIRKSREWITGVIPSSPFAWFQFNGFFHIRRVF